MFLFVVFIGQEIQAPAIYKAKKECLTLVEQIENGSITDSQTQSYRKNGEYYFY